MTEIQATTAVDPEALVYATELQVRQNIMEQVREWLNVNEATSQPGSRALGTRSME